MPPNSIRTSRKYNSSQSAPLEDSAHVDTLTSGVLAFVEDLDAAYYATRGEKNGGSSPRAKLEPFGSHLDDCFTPEGVIRVLTEFSRGHHNPVRSKEWHTEFFENVDFLSYSLEDLEDLRGSVVSAIAEKRNAGAA